ncbi:MAG: hypothetical protein CL902_06575 [Dehalococcoidia bacterium]|nr:hypothetical protein [Dehalococcoidia bacterium]|tara:strand:+ start:158 stop:628 length:471 start_codon:yes stop_codon:yes gene_type:complete
MDLGLQTGDQELLAEALELRKAVVGMVPNSRVFLNELAEDLIRLNQPEAALVTLEKLLIVTELDSGFTQESLKLQGIALRQLGRFQEALASLDQAILLDPAFGVALVERGLVYYQLGQSERALEDLNAAIETPGDAAETYYLRGVSIASWASWRRL